MKADRRSYSLLTLTLLSVFSTSLYAGYFVRNETDCTVVATVTKEGYGRRVTDSLRIRPGETGEVIYGDISGYWTFSSAYCFAEGRRWEWREVSQYSYGPNLTRTLTFR